MPPARWMFVVAFALVAVACSSPAVTLDPKASGKVTAGPTGRTVEAGVEVAGPSLTLGSGAVAAPPGASWPASAAAPAQASPAPVEPASADPSGPPRAKPGSDSCAGGVCVPPSTDAGSAP